MAFRKKTYLGGDVGVELQYNEEKSREEVASVRKGQLS